MACRCCRAQGDVDLNGNYDAGPVVKPLQVSVAGVVQNYTFDTTGENAGNAAGRYVTKSFTFVANASSATISFVSDAKGQGTNAGAVIDNVRITQLTSVPLDWAQWAAALAIALAGIAWFRRDAVGRRGLR